MPISLEILQMNWSYEASRVLELFVICGLLENSFVAEFVIWQHFWTQIASKIVGQEKFDSNPSCFGVLKNERRENMKQKSKWI